jgi:hypothetical protein
MGCGPRRQCRPNYSVACIASTVFPSIFSGVVEIRPIEERVKELCARAATVDDSEVPALLAELKGLLAEHSEFVRYLAAKTLNRAYKESSPSKAAD